MINLEQIKLLEKKVAKAVDYVERLAKENVSLRQQKAELHTKLESYQKRIDELEALIIRFREEQGEIEDGILAALDRLSRFEEEMEKSLKGKGSGGKSTAAKTSAKAAAKPAAAAPIEVNPTGGEICFEIPETAAGSDIIDPLGEDPEDALTDTADPPEGDGELDIF
jgi:peptidoglycan hydrolase CwlO-like protein